MLRVWHVARGPWHTEPVCRARLTASPSWVCSAAGGVPSARQRHGLSRPPGQQTRRLPGRQEPRPMLEDPQCHLDPLVQGHTGLQGCWGLSAMSLVPGEPGTTCAVLRSYARPRLPAPLPAAPAICTSCGLLLQVSPLWPGEPHLGGLTPFSPATSCPFFPGWGFHCGSPLQ